MQTYVVKFKSFKSGIRLYPLEKIPKINKRRGTFIPDSWVCVRKKDVGQPENLVALTITSQNTELNLFPIWFWIIGKVSSFKTEANCLLIWPLFLQGVSLKVQGQTIAIST